MANKMREITETNISFVYSQSMSLSPDKTIGIETFREKLFDTRVTVLSNNVC